MTNLQLKAQEPVYGGYVLHRSEEDGITFIKGAIPGELVEVEIDSKKRDYRTATVVEVLEPSPNRIEPACQYFGECGGCHLQFIKYPMQVEMKDNVVLDCLRRLGGLDVNLDPPLYGEPFGYRRRGQFKVSRQGAVGFFSEGTRDVVEIESCPLVTNEINEALKSVRNCNLDGVREIHLTHGESVMALVKGAEFSESLTDELMEAGITGIAFQDGSYRGEGVNYTTFDLNGLKYTASPWSFIQSNWQMNRKMVERLAEEVGQLADMRLLDLYAGAGNFSLPLAIDAKETVAVEENKHAIEDGKRNANINRITGYRYAKGTAEMAKLKGEFDLFILDPPRTGLSKTAIERVSQIQPPRIAYVSCNPSTLGRDMRRLSDFYTVDTVQVADMFPNTYHVECILMMTKK